MTNLNCVAIRCMNDSKHQMFQARDGARCVECNSMMMPIPVSEEQYRTLPSYAGWHKQRSQKPKHSISIVVEADTYTDKLPLKLRAIAKHAEALANELDTIDNESYITSGVTEIANKVTEEIKRTIANF